MKRNTRVRFLTEAAMIAAGYTVLTLLAMMLNLAYGPVQFRFSEALTVLPVLTPSAACSPIYGAVWGRWILFLVRPLPCWPR